MRAPAGGGERDGRRTSAKGTGEHQSCCLGSTGSPAPFHAVQPPVRARAFFHPARRSSRATRALVASSFHAQYSTTVA